MKILKFHFCNLYFALSLTLLSLAVLGAAPPAKKSPAKVSITTRLDQTAMWVGDLIHYTVRAVHDKDIEFVLDNIHKENFSLAPFVVRDAKIQGGDWAQNKKFLEITFSLTTYDSGKTELTIPSFHLYYFLRDTQVERKEAQAESVQVPAMKVGLRSTLGSGPMKLRDSTAVASLEPWHWLAPLVLGITGMLYLVVQGGKWAWIFLHAARAPKKRLSRYAMDKWVQENFARIRGLEGDSPEKLTHFYSEVAQFLRQYLTERLEIEAAGLTPEEIEQALIRAGMNGSNSRQVRTVLEQCEIVHYRKDGIQRGAELKSGVLEAVEKVVRTPVI